MHAMCTNPHKQATHLHLHLSHTLQADASCVLLQGMMPLLPLVLPPGLPTMLPEASQHVQQGSQAGAQPQQAPQAQQMVYTPFSGMMLPPSVVPGAHTLREANSSSP